MSESKQEQAEQAEQSAELSATERAEAAMQAHGLTVSAEFVPWSKSRNKGEKERSLNWRVTVLRNARPILGPLDYSAGAGHCPAYEYSRKVKPRPHPHDIKALCEWECEHGYPASILPGGAVLRRNKTAIMPDAPSVLYSLLSDSSAIECATFEEWAADMGYDPDSREGERIYRACLEIGLKLRATLGDTVLAELRDAFQDY